MAQAPAAMGIGPREIAPIRFGTIVFLASELVFFGGVFAAYFTLPSAAHPRAPRPFELPLRGRPARGSCRASRVAQPMDRGHGPPRPGLPGPPTARLGPGRLLGLVQRLRHDGLRDDRLPRAARDRRGPADARDPWTHDPGGISGRNHRWARGGGVLLALRRRRVGRPLRDDLPPSVSPR